MLERNNRRVGKPIVAVILLTCRLRPSLIDSFIQLVGICTLLRIGGDRLGKLGVSIMFAAAIRVLPSASITPERN